MYRELVGPISDISVSIFLSYKMTSFGKKIEILQLTVQLRKLGRQLDSLFDT